MINGIAEDGISTVSFNLRNGSSRQAAVGNNAFTVTIPNHVLNDLTGYTVTRSNGAQTSYTYPSGEFLSPGAMATLNAIYRLGNRSRGSNVGYAPRPTTKEKS